MIKTIVFLLLLSQAALAGLPPTTSKVSGDSSDLTTFKFRFPNFTGTHTGTLLSLGVNAIAGGGTGQTSKTAAFDALSPNTTKGDITIHNGTNNVRFGVCSNGDQLQADSTQATGWKCVTPSSGSSTLTVVTKTANYTATNADNVILADATSGPITITMALTTAAGIAGRPYVVKKIDTSVNAVTIAVTGGDVIDGETTQVLNTQYSSLSLVSDNGGHYEIY